MAGRKAVSFRYGPWALPMEFQPMAADFPAPRGIAGGGAGFPDAAFPQPNRWHHVAYVFTGGRDLPGRQAGGEMRLYVDGVLNHRRERYILYTMPGQPMHIGTSWNTATGTGSMFSGSLAGVKVYDYARTAQEIRDAAGRQEPPR